MTAISTYGKTGDPYIDGILSGRKWAVSELTFSFPTDGSLYGSNYGSGENLKNFEAFNAQQQAATKQVLSMISSVSNLKFVQVTDSATVKGELRYAMSDAPSTAWAYYPSTSAAGGDSWYNNSSGWYDNPVKGNYAYLTILHETGHALGLKHAHEVTTFGAIPADKDSLEYTVMSYKSYVGGPTTGYTNGSTSYPQSLMMLDIAALQKLYGANYTTNSGDTVYRWSPTTGEMSINGVGQGAPAGNKIFLTVWDGGGNDTFDFSNYTTNLKIDLQPGAWSTTSSTQLASLGGGKVAAGNIANALLFEGNPASLIENAIGGSGADTITGNAANNVLRGNGGNDILNGLDGFDTAVYSGAIGDYRITQNADGSWTIADLRTNAPDGTDTLWFIEQAQFSNGFVALSSGSQEPTKPTEPTEPTTTEPDVVVTNTAPVAANDSYSTGYNKKLTVNPNSSVLKNDTDADGDALSASLVSTTSKGKLVFKSDGTFSYTPDKNFRGTDTFTYKVTDGEGFSEVATVTIAVGVTSTSGKISKGGFPAKDFGGGFGRFDSHFHSWRSEDKHGHHDLHEIPAPVALAESRMDSSALQFDDFIAQIARPSHDHFLV